MLRTCVRHAGGARGAGRRPLRAGPADERAGRRRARPSGRWRSPSAAGAGWSEHDEVGAGSVLPLLADDAVRAFADGLLRPLREHDATARGDLVASLRAWLSRHGQWDAAAADLGVHRHTLRYRMRRVEEILGRSLDDPDVRMELWLALKTGAPDDESACRGATAATCRTMRTSRRAAAYGGHPMPCAREDGQRHRLSEGRVSAVSATREAVHAFWLAGRPATGDGHLRRHPPLGRPPRRARSACPPTRRSRRPSRPRTPPWPDSPPPRRTSAPPPSTTSPGGSPSAPRRSPS